MSVFNGINPNGAWLLFVFDDTHLNSGIISNGWLLHLTTAAPVLPAADVGLVMSAVSNSVILTSNLTFTLDVTNYGPGIASNVVVSDVLPNGSVFSSSEPEGELSTNSAGLLTLTWNFGTLLKGAGASMVLTVQPGLVGTATNFASVSTTSNDLNPSDSSAAVGAEVVGPTADLVLNLVSTPNSVALGGTYTLTAAVTNLGPASAPGMAVVFYLDPTVNFVSASPPGSLDNADNIVTFTNLPILGRNQGLSVAAVVQPTILSENLTYATCYAAPDVIDLFKSNADGSVKTVVVSPLTLQVLTPSPNSVLLAWPAGQGVYNVQVATNLTPPVNWTTVTNPAPSLVGGQYIFTHSIGAGNLFFRLNLATP
jgi:uncharacterized repeat protein (TIGR01451 family)